MSVDVDLVCLSHLRWNFVYQRPQHLMRRAARSGRVFYVEEAVSDATAPFVETVPTDEGVTVVIPHLPLGTDGRLATTTLTWLMSRLFAEQDINDHLLWYYTPMAVPFTEHLEPLAIVYDCMDELSQFALAPTDIVRNEQRLLRRADLVFTGGQSLYERKRRQHRHVHAFPSSVDRRHFAQARAGLADPADQAAVPHPRIGFYGVIDERMDLVLLQGVAELHPEWQFVMIGPVAKIEESALPQRDNIHYLGRKSYEELPAYLAGWDVAMLPFARNESTQFISPTKTPEYLAAGKPVVSTSIRDVVRPYGLRGLVRIADEPEAFADAIRASLGDDMSVRVPEFDRFLAAMSWDTTWGAMEDLVESAIDTRRLAMTEAGAV